MNAKQPFKGILKAAFARPTRFAKGMSIARESSLPVALTRAPCLSSKPSAESKGDIVQPDNTFTFNDLEIQLQPRHLRRKKPNDNSLPFGKYFADHMFESYWTKDSGWGKPKICAFHDLQIHPAAKVLHYAHSLFEGMKAYRGLDGKIRLFRPELNVKRLLSSAKRLALPAFDAQEFLRCLIRLVNIDKYWVPTAPLSSLYIRPAFMGIQPTLGVGPSCEALLYVITGPVGSYHSTCVEAVGLLADSKYVRSWPGGTGDKKLGCNYASTISVQMDASAMGLQQVLWLYGEDQQITEVGAMNIFVLLRGKDGVPELVTPPLNGLVLPGITRMSILDLTREWNEFKVSERIITLGELKEALKEDRLMEVFGCGTACVISPVDKIVHRRGKQLEELYIPTMKSELALYARITKSITDIQYGIVGHPWSLEVV